jgi:hypothetical protein
MQKFYGSRRCGVSAYYRKEQGTLSYRNYKKLYRKAPRWARIAIGALAFILVAATLNLIFQVVRKPAELFFPVSGVLSKTPSETWREYAALFRAHSTPLMTPELLAALAQVEGSGNPIVRTYWRWSFTPEPFEVYRPASSAVGMYQITNGTFAEARRYCIHDHRVVEDGPWNDWRSCWFNSLYSRVIPSHAVELTAAFLDRRIAQILARRRIARASLEQKHDLAAVIHLCGAGAGDSYARRGFRLRTRERCGDHDVRSYLARVDAMRAVFRGLAARED